MIYLSFEESLKYIKRETDIKLSNYELVRLCNQNKKLNIYLLSDELISDYRIETIGGKWRELKLQLNSDEGKSAKKMLNKKWSEYLQLQQPKLSVSDDTSSPFISFYSLLSASMAIRFLVTALQFENTLAIANKYLIEKASDHNYGYAGETKKKIIEATYISGADEALKAYCYPKAIQALGSIIITYNGNFVETVALDKTYFRLDELNIVTEGLTSCMSSISPEPQQVEPIKDNISPKPEPVIDISRIHNNIKNTDNANAFVKLLEDNIDGSYVTVNDIHRLSLPRDATSAHKKAFGRWKSKVNGLITDKGH